MLALYFFKVNRIYDYFKPACLDGVCLLFYFVCSVSVILKPYVGLQNFCVVQGKQNLYFFMAYGDLTLQI